MSNYDHFCFDLDGTLIDSENLIKNAWEFSIKKSKTPYKKSFQEFRKYIGLPFKNVLTSLDIESSYHDEIKKYFDLYSLNNVEEIKLFPYVNQTLNELKNRQKIITIFTSKDLIKAKRILLKFQIHNHISEMISGSQHKSLEKPSGKALTLLCKKVKVKREKTIYFGDTKFDEIAADNSKIKFIHASWGMESKEKFEDSIKNPLDILNYT